MSSVAYLIPTSASQINSFSHKIFSE